MDAFVESLRVEWEAVIALMPRLILALIILAFAFLLGRILSRGASHLMERGRFESTHQSFFRNLIFWIAMLFGFVLALNALGWQGLAAGLIAGGSLTAVAVGFAFKEIGENFLAGFFLAFSRPFEVGDLIQSQDLKGVVRGITLRSTHIRSADGRDIFIPSSQIFKSPVINYTLDGLRRISFEVGIDYADDAQRARHLLLDAVRSVGGIEETPAPGVNIKSLEPQFVALEIFFWTDTFKANINLREVRNRVIEEVRKVLLENDFTVSSNVSTNISVVSSGSSAGSA